MTALVACTMAAVLGLLFDLFDLLDFLDNFDLLLFDDLWSRRFPSLRLTLRAEVVVAPHPVNVRLPHRRSQLLQIESNVAIAVSRDAILAPVMFLAPRSVHANYLDWTPVEPVVEVAAWTLLARYPHMAILLVIPAHLRA